MLGNTVWEQLVNSFTNAGTSGWSALISWRHHRELRWTQLYGLPVSPCMNIMKTLTTKVYFSLEQSLTHTHTHIHRFRQRGLPRMTHSLRLFQFFGWPKLPQKNIGWSSQVPRDNSPLDMKWFTLLSKVVYVAVVKGVCASSVFMKWAHQFSFLSRMLHSNVPRCRLS